METFCPFLKNYKYLAFGGKNIQLYLLLMLKIAAISRKKAQHRVKLSIYFITLHSEIYYDTIPCCELLIIRQLFDMLTNKTENRSSMYEIFENAFIKF